MKRVCATSDYAFGSPTYSVEWPWVVALKRLQPMGRCTSSPHPKPLSQGGEGLYSGHSLYRALPLATHGAVTAED